MRVLCTVCLGLALAAGFAGGCASGDSGAGGQETLSGQITYRERVELPSGAAAIIELVESSRSEAASRTIARQRIEPVRQVPVRFTLHYDRARLDTTRSYALNARIEEPGGAVLFQTPEVGVDPLRGLRVEILLQPAPVAGDPAETAAMPWERARAAGVDLRAVGQEPGWVLELTEDALLVLVTDYGRWREAYPNVERELAEGGAIAYRARREDRNIEVTVRPEPCTDVMSGERFPLTVTVLRDSVQLQGCGRRLR